MSTVKLRSGCVGARGREKKTTEVAPKSEQTSGCAGARGREQKGWHSNFEEIEAAPEGEKHREDPQASQRLGWRRGARLTFKLCSGCARDRGRDTTKAMLNFRGCAVRGREKEVSLRLHSGCAGAGQRTPRWHSNFAAVVPAPGGEKNK